jgi:lipopolysaccharide transport system ATP-binding protein
MNDIVIKAENLGKKYLIGHQAERGGYMALRDVLMQNARTPLEQDKRPGNGEANHTGRHDGRSMGAQ